MTVENDLSLTLALLLTLLTLNPCYALDLKF